MKTLGVVGSVVFSVQRRRFYYRFSMPRKPFYLRSKKARYSLLCRPHSSDFEIFDQIFCQCAYACLDGLRDVRLVLDCGAYIGYSSAYFLTQFPNCELIAVEPDQSNFAILQQNLRSYGDRARLINAGIWSHPTGLVIDRTTTYRSGRECTRQVRECAEREPAGFPAVDITTLLRESGYPQIDILKIDIEGAECVIFSSNFRGWLERTNHIVIELHDDTHFGEATSIFYRACGHTFRYSRSGELTFASRR